MSRISKVGAAAAVTMAGTVAGLVLVLWPADNGPQAVSRVMTVGHELAGRPGSDDELDARLVGEATPAEGSAGEATPHGEVGQPPRGGQPPAAGDAAGRGPEPGTSGASPAVPRQQSASVSPPPLPVAVQQPPATTASDAAAVAEAERVAEAFARVIDPELTPEARAPYLEDAERLRPAQDAYAAVARLFVGKVRLRPTVPPTNADHVAFTFDLVGADGTTLMGGLPADARRVAGRWQISRAAFCSAVALVTISCPA